MLFALEIMLSVSAWKKGWKGWIIVPWVAIFLAAMALCGAASSQDETFGIGLICDILLIIVLGIMAATAYGNQIKP